MGKPVAVGYDKGNRGVVASASYEARAFGVRSAMSMYQAMKLCPGLIRVRPTHGIYSKSSREIMAYLADFTPHMVVASVDEAYLDMTGSERLFGDLETVAERIRREIQEIFGVPASVGGGSNKYIAKMATTFAKPNGVHIVKPGKEQDFLFPLPVKAVPGIGPKTAAVLVRNGIKTLRDVALASDDLLKHCCGHTALWAKALVLGEEQSLPQPRGQAKSISHSETFFDPATSLEDLEGWLFSTVIKMAYKMRSKGLHCGKVGIVARKTDMTTRRREKRLPKPGIVDTELLDTLLPLLREVFLWSGGEIRLIGAVLGDLEPNRAQPELFPTKRDKKIDLQKTLDSLNTRFGNGSVTFASRGVTLKRDKKK